MRQIGLRWPDDLIAQVDEARGSTSRSEFIRSCVASCLAEAPPPNAIAPFGMASKLCAHPKPWNQLGYGTFCSACGKKMR